MGDVFDKVRKTNTLLFISLCRIRVCKFYGIASTTFGTGTKNVRRVDLPNSAYFSLPGR